MVAETEQLLDDVLIDRGLTLEGLAGLLRATVAGHGLRSGTDKKTIWRWKTGQRVPTLESQRFLAESLGVPDKVVSERSWPDWLRHAVTDRCCVLRLPWSRAGTMQALHDVAGGPMDRRKFMITTGSALASVTGQWSGAVAASADEPDHGTTPARVTAAMMDRLENRLADLRHLDDSLGGAGLHELAVAEFRWLTQLADTSSYDAPTGQRLFTLITEAARLCGWLHFDAGHHAQAQTHYIAALRASATANDPVTGANVLAGMSFQALSTGHYHDAVQLIDRAAEQLGSNATPRLRALLESRKARAQAAGGDAAACGHSLNEAEKSLEVASHERWEPDWIYYFDEAEFAAQSGACWVDLHQPDKARSLIDDALGTIDPNYVRDRTIYHVRSSQAFYQHNELELACAQLTEAADLAGRTGSVRAVTTLRQARRSMSTHEDDHRVRELDQQLAALPA